MFFLNRVCAKSLGQICIAVYVHAGQFTEQKVMTNPNFGENLPKKASCSSDDCQKGVSFEFGEISSHFRSLG